MCLPIVTKYIPPKYYDRPAVREITRNAASSDYRWSALIQAIVETPMNLTKKQMELLKEFDKSGSPETTSPESEGFFTRVKELWEDLKD